MDEHADLHARLSQEVRQLEADFARPVPPPIELTAQGLVPFPISPLDPECPKWWERIQSVRDHGRWVQDAADPGGTVAVKVEEYLGRRRAEAEAGQIRPSTYMAVRDRLPHFKEYCGETDASKIDERTLTGYHAHLLNKAASGTISPQYAAHLLSMGKAFCRWLWRERVLEHLPRNLDALKITVAAREIPTFDLKVLGRILEAASERTRLYLLLMMNIGAYQSDVAALKPSQVDWASGRITRKRTKTEAQANTPKVSYLLWDETFRLLQKHGRQDGPLALVNENGSPLYRRPVNGDGSVGLTDNIKKGYERVCKKLKVKPTPLMYLRKTSATLLESEGEYARFVDDFLGHAPSTLARARYARTDPSTFDEAIRWLGGKYGFPTTR